MRRAHAHVAVLNEGSDRKRFTPEVYQLDKPTVAAILRGLFTADGTVDYFINNVFNYPTLAEAYKVAALNGLNKLRHM